jgi:hypothetical protein
VAAQVVNGTNYFFKVKIAAFEFIHLRVHVSLFGDEPKLVAMRKGEVAAGPLEFFEYSVTDERERESRDCAHCHESG